MSSNNEGEINVNSSDNDDTISNMNKISRIRSRDNESYEKYVKRIKVNESLKKLTQEEEKTVWYSVIYGDYNLLTLTIKAGYDVASLKLGKSSLLHLLCTRDIANLEIIKFYLENVERVNINALDEHSYTPLMYYLSGKRLCLSSYLSGKKLVFHSDYNLGANVSFRESSSHTSTTNNDIVQYLIDKGTDLNVVTDKYESVIRMYFNYRDFNPDLIIVKQLFENTNKQHIPPNLLFIYGCNALYLDPVIVEFMLDSSIDVNYDEYCGNTCETNNIMTIILNRRHSSEVFHLVLSQKDFRFNNNMYHYFFPYVDDLIIKDDHFFQLHFLFENEIISRDFHIPITQARLLQFQNMKMYLSTPKLKLSKLQREKMIEKAKNNDFSKLVEYHDLGYDIICYEGYIDPHKSPLHYACKFGNNEMIKFLVEKGADVNLTYEPFNYFHRIPFFDCTPLAMYLSSNKHNCQVEMVSYLIDNGAQIVFTLKNDMYITILFKWYLLLGHFDINIISLLLTDATRDRIDSPLCLYIWVSPELIFEDILQLIPLDWTKEGDNVIESAFYTRWWIELVKRRCSIDLFNKLLDTGIQLDTCPEELLSLLIPYATHAVPIINSHSHSQNDSLSLSNSECDKDSRSLSNSESLQLVFANGKSVTMNNLKPGMAVKKKRYHDRITNYLKTHTKILSSSQMKEMFDNIHNDFSLVKKFDSEGYNIVFTHFKKEDVYLRESILSLAYHYGNIEMVQFCIDRGFDPDYDCFVEMRPFLNSYSFHPDVVKYFILNCDYDVNLLCRYKRNALQSLIYNNDIDLSVIECILEAGLDITYIDPLSNQTVLMSVIHNVIIGAQDFCDIIALLLKYNASVVAVDNNGWNAIMYLLNRGKQPNDHILPWLLDAVMKQL